MAKAAIWWDPRGRLNVVARATLDGKALKRRRIVAQNDETLAQDIVRQLNLQFAMGDLSWLLDGQRPRTKSSNPTLSEWAEIWLERCRPPVIGRRTWENYAIAKRDLVKRLGDRRLASIDPKALLGLRDELERSGLSQATIVDRLGVLRMIFQDARLHCAAIASSPFDVGLPRRRTKKSARARSRHVQFRPFVAKELEALLKELRAPRDARDQVYYPATELLLLTGLRWGEGVGILWSDISWTGARVNIRRAVVRGEDDPDEPTKTGVEWTILLREPLEDLLRRQRLRTQVGRSEGRVFTGPRGGPMSYHEWRKRGWLRPIQRAKISPREGDAQKALRRSYITSALISGRYAKAVSEELGHRTTRMLTDVYDSFLGPSGWPDSAEIGRLRALYGWDASEAVNAARR